ncbi:MAG TPA: translation initiation factor IF-2 subunit alpha [Thermoplasmata archaeon]|nr:translation initiation factor IF-2 subunit alpha [Thermoplasmata archaeon]
MARPVAFPEEGDLVVGTVHSVKNFGAFVWLDEYPSPSGQEKIKVRETARMAGGEDGPRFAQGDFAEGFIHIAEVATGWIKYIRDYVREGQKVVCKVIKVDTDKRQVDLSLKSVNEHQKREKIQEWKNEQKAAKLLGIVAQKLKKTPEECTALFGDALVDAFGTLYRAFEECSMDEKALQKAGLKGDWTKALAEVARENIVPPYVTIDGYLELTSLAPDGAGAIREALKKVGKEDHVTVKVQYIGAPRYRVVVRAPDYKSAEDEILKAAQRAIKHIQSHDGEGKFQRREE